MKKFVGKIVGHTDQYQVGYEVTVRAHDEDEARRLFQREIEGAACLYRLLLKACCVNLWLESFWPL